jgi:hypothetical protein
VAPIITEVGQHVREVRGEAEHPAHGDSPHGCGARISARERDHERNQPEANHVAEGGGEAALESCVVEPPRRKGDEMHDGERETQKHRQPDGRQSGTDGERHDGARRHFTAHDRLVTTVCFAVSGGIDGIV